MSFKKMEKKKYRYTFDLIFREHIQGNSIENEKMVKVHNYNNQEPQKLEHAIANLFDGLSRDSYIDRTLYHLAKFEAKDREANESFKAQIDKYVNYLLNTKKVVGVKNVRTKGHTNNPNH